MEGRVTHQAVARPSPPIGNALLKTNMKYGISTSIDKSQALRDAGWDYIEENVQQLLCGQTADDQWAGATRVAQSALPVEVGNCLVPGNLPIVGERVDEAALQRYMNAVLRRAGQLKIGQLVFGSGGARQVPDGFDRDRAKQQILAFLQNSVRPAESAGVVIVIEPLRRQECNIINSVGEAMSYVQQIDHPAVQCLVDSYHFWQEGDSLDDLRAAMPWISHVHLADKDGRVAPGLSGTADYRPFFRVLKEGGYDGRMSFEGNAFVDFAVTAPKVLQYIKQEWSAA
jgi:sugar phosphate isomerase/epimerase